MRAVRDPRGRDWEIRERWLHPIGGLPPSGAADSFGSTGFGPIALIEGLLGLAISLLRWLLMFPLALFRLGFAAPLIEAERLGEPHVKLTWRARNRQVGPEVIERISRAIEAGDVSVDVEDATFLGFD